jgi:hypothetical protein
MNTYITLLFTATFTLFASSFARADEPLPLAHIDHPYQRVEQLFAAVPSGASLDQQQFEPTMGPDVAEYLNLLGLSHIESVNGAVKLSLDAEYNGRTKAGTKIHMDREVHFTYSRDAEGTILCADITGLRVKPFRLMGWMPLTQITVKNGPTGNTIFEIQVVTIIGSISRTTKVGQDGQVLK